MTILTEYERQRAKIADWAETAQEGLTENNLEKVGDALEHITSVPSGKERFVSEIFRAEGEANLVADNRSTGGRVTGTGVAIKRAIREAMKQDKRAKKVRTWLERWTEETPYHVRCVSRGNRVKQNFSVFVEDQYLHQVPVDGSRPIKLDSLPTLLSKIKSEAPQ